MNIFKGLLFLEGYLTTTEFADDFDQGERYGTRAASARQFGAPSADDRRDVASVSADAQPAACGCG